MGIIILGSFGCPQLSKVMKRIMRSTVDHAGEMTFNNKFPQKILILFSQNKAIIDNLLHSAFQNYNDTINTYRTYFETTKSYTRACAYRGVRNVSFSENFANVLNE